MKVIVDAFGGDNAPKEIVKGAVFAVNNNRELEVVLVGKENEIKQLLNDFNYNGQQIEIVNANDVVTNHDSPTSVIKQKPDSSLVKALDLLKTGENYAGVVSAGSTGALLTGSFLKLGRIKGVSRPALSPLLPTVNGGVVSVIDVGANVDAKPINLVHFAIMASIYFESVLKIKNPKVALLNVGTEDEKGNELAKETFNLLKQVKEINFVGNIEGRDVLSGDVDIVVTDGFSGNIFLKSTEGAVETILTLLKRGIKSSFLSKIGYLFMKKTFRNLKNTLDYSKKGGAIFLGCKKIAIKAHGSSKAESISVAIQQAFDLAKENVVEKIENSMANIDLESISVSNE